MLDQAADLDTVCSPIETLDLRRTVDAVLLASTLINTQDPALRTAMLNTARRHTNAGGTLIIQRRTPQWHDDLVSSSVERNGIQYTVGAMDRHGQLLRTTIEYQVGHQRSTQTFAARRLSDDELVGILDDAGFGNIRWLTADHSWLVGPW